MMETSLQSSKRQQLYPRPRREKIPNRRWRVDYDLAYDGGGTCWSGYYHWKILALIASFWNVYISSWGGTAILFDQH
jgi:hypothetical protein